ncbi:cell cycle associated protein MOB1, putative [Trypanosoma cruzi]|uniref:Putative cell cycle associated protein MOB1 n=1 Tax=Trypanosoma cruzi TaxID=5693 RepID=A0A2V2VDF4_TRYCR|nr:cell cycle associated protein MOB1, putative [Trypanosoma cruzi]PBJ71736.1 cell cycle associated protein MOB1 [Trypanosoma cruzi cruzi]KAF8281297.1 putative cell cycle associated protein MOB1 [Trypanosoma cruzi]PBJ78982.1 cell cycle associated protein MOB1 [Trypanosoma cruzi cruzi]PWU93616.1 putative cell cycle associated protein MOB1 [Trypanosoma cruzi]
MKKFRAKLFDSDRTYKPKKKHKEGTERYNLHKFAKSLVRSGDLSKAVRLPQGANPNHWLSVHTVDFYNITNVLYGSLTEFCTTSSCPVMSSGPRYEYLWKDPPEYPKATKVSAPEYVRLLMEWIEKQINDERIFPSEDRNPYPPDFVERVKICFKRLFRVYAHVYYSHFAKIRELQEESHINTALKHFMYFVWEFDLIPREEVSPLHELLINLMGQRAKDKLEAA